MSKKSIYETILQSHLFLGFPAMIEAARLFSGITNSQFKRNQLPGPYDSKTVRTWNRDGMDKIRRLYGSSFDRLVLYINSFSPQILTWMINNGYGQVLSRTGVTFDIRELCVIATLTVTMYENQLRAHLRGALNIEVAIEDVEAVIDNCRFFCTKKNIQASRKILKEVAREINA
ncbi:MAG: carboxymuconolactone decarboxylase family protein [candidate division Zixibacteria bacterium]